MREPAPRTDGYQITASLRLAQVDLTSPMLRWPEIERPRISPHKATSRPETGSPRSATSSCAGKRTRIGRYPVKCPLGWQAF